MLDTAGNDLAGGTMVVDDNGDRLAQRREVLLQARCRKSSWHVFAVEIGDVSQGGCSIIGSAENFVVGDAVQLRIANLRPIDGEVRWLQGDKVGVEFRTAFSRQAIADLSAVYGITL